MFKHILVPTDGSPLSLKAAKLAASLAASEQAKVTAVHVTPPYRPPVGGDSVIYYPESFSPAEYRKAMDKTAQKALDRIEAVVARAKVPFARVALTHDQPWESIIETAKKRRCDLIVMASHGRRGLAGLLIGSETTKVLTHSRTPVLVCR